jgi:hypothetical protein
LIVAFFFGLLFSHFSFNFLALCFFAFFVLLLSVLFIVVVLSIVIVPVVVIVIIVLSFFIFFFRFLSVLLLLFFFFLLVLFLGFVMSCLAFFGLVTVSLAVISLTFISFTFIIRFLDRFGLLNISVLLVCFEVDAMEFAVVGTTPVTPLDEAHDDFVK